MVEERCQVLLSPPDSPPMSDKATEIGDYHHGPDQSHDTARAECPPQYSPDRSIPVLRPFRSTPRSMESGGHYRHGNYPAAPPNHGDRPVLSGAQPVGPADLLSVTYDDSTPAGPTDRLTPRSPGASTTKDAAEDDDLMDDSAGEDPDDEGERRPMTAKELRARKKKMRRFRLTHSQTRFLMSEFARQPQPDAANRERLAREIPGLTARQVQVWFQNRRAKLKRLNADDRERMMRSRALPADFDTTQALHSPFAAPPPSMGAPISTIGGYAAYADASAVPPLTMDSLRRVPDHEQYGQQYASPTGVSLAFTPPHSVSEHLSPASAASSMSPYVLPPQAPYEASGRPRTGLSSSGHAAFVGQPPHPQPLPLHERLTCTVGEARGSPLRTSVSYSTLNGASARRHMLERAASFSDHHFQQQRLQLQSIGNPSGNETGPYGLGFSYSQMPQYQRNCAPQQALFLGGPIQSPADAVQCRRPGVLSSAYSAYPSSTTYGGTSHVPHYAGYPAQYASHSYSSAFAPPGQVTGPGSQLAQQMHDSQPCSAAAPSHQHMLGGYNGLEVTEGQTHGSAY